MNVLIVGNNEFNEILGKKFEEANINTTVIMSADDVLKVKGEPGVYVVTTPHETVSVSSVVITERAEFEAPEIDGNSLYNLADAVVREKVLNDKTKNQVVILLDYGAETPEYITQEAVELSLQLANRKKKVVFLSRFVKSAGKDREEANRKAREAGVVFVKYESISLQFDEDSQKFKIKANDGVLDIETETSVALSAWEKENSTLAGLVKKLRLHNSTAVNSTEDRFFLHPVFTTRRGIYHANLQSTKADAPEKAEDAVRLIVRDMSAMTDEDYVFEIVRGQSFPEIDVAKCAFCYTCHRACPHGALEPDIENDGMKTVESTCHACGICIAICPGDAISRKAEETNGKKSTQETEREQSKNESGICKVFCCENGAVNAYKEIEKELTEAGTKIDMEAVTCGGAVGADVISTAMSTYDKVLIACCHEGACRHIDGEKRGCKQAERVVAMLSKANVGSKKVEVIKVSHPMRNVLKDKLITAMQ
jgi:Fe-S-cluster-containing hydrogenase component 2